MKTQTRLQILKLIEKKGKIRPFDLHQSLGLSPQVIHRHLKKLVEQGMIEVRGAPPFTQYAPAGVPDYKTATHWVSARAVPKGSESFVCETRDIFTARLPRLKSFSEKGLSEKLLPLVISTAGEVGNNSFDHNLGQWRDVPGCWFEPQVSGRHLWIYMADRGQGIYHSLTQVHPELKNEQDALRAAFETIISGRTPEHRGNGLKFVKESISNTSGSGIACISGSARVYYGEEGERCEHLLDNYFTNVRGTVTLMAWRLL